MIELAILLSVSVLPAVYTWWRFAGYWAYRMAENDSMWRKHRRSRTNEWTPDGEAWFAGYSLGIAVGILWPAVVVFLLVGKVHKTLSINYIPKDQKRRFQQARIERMDRELGLGEYRR